MQRRKSFCSAATKCCIFKQMKNDADFVHCPFRCLFKSASLGSLDRKSSTVIYNDGLGRMRANSLIDVSKLYFDGSINSFEQHYQSISSEIDSTDVVRIKKREVSDRFELVLKERRYLLENMPLSDYSFDVKSMDESDCTLYETKAVSKTNSDSSNFQDKLKVINNCRSEGNLTLESNASCLLYSECSLTQSEDVDDDSYKESIRKLSQNKEVILEGDLHTISDPKQSLSSEYDIEKKAKHTSQEVEIKDELQLREEKTMTNQFGNNLDEDINTFLEQTSFKDENEKASVKEKLLKMNSILRDELECLKEQHNHLQQRKSKTREAMEKRSWFQLKSFHPFTAFANIAQKELYSKLFHDSLGTVVLQKFFKPILSRQSSEERAIEEMDLESEARKLYLDPIKTDLSQFEDDATKKMKKDGGLWYTNSSSEVTLLTYNALPPTLSLNSNKDKEDEVVESKA